MTFDLNGGSGNVPAVQTLDFDSLALAPVDPTRTGYTFKGWNTLANGKGSAWNFETSMMPGNNVILYAQWEENPKPVPPAPKPEDGKTGELSHGELLKTGGLGVVLISLITLGIGAVVSARSLKKK